jgi:glycosyltransferase involved in cell wall biosynthesis
MTAATAVARSPGITVVVQTHNRAPLVPRALRSVLAQSDGDFRLLVIDDGSRDGTAAALAPFTQDPRLRLLVNEQGQGTLPTRNRAVREADTEWLVFLDDDDELLPQYLEKLRALIAAQAAAGVRLGLVWSSAERDYAGEPQRSDTVRFREAWDGVQPYPHHGLLQFSTCWGVAARREALLAIGGFDERVTGLGDIDLALRLAANGTPYATLDEPLVRVHLGEGLSVSRGRTHHTAQRELLLRNNAAFLAAHPTLLAHYRRHAMSGFYREGDKAGGRRMAAALLRSGRLGGRGFEMLLRFELVEPLKRLLRGGRGKPGAA